MNDVSMVSRLPVSPEAPDADRNVEELENKLVPVEQEQLPQGIADLLATMIWRQRPLSGKARPDQSLHVQPLQAGISPIDRRVTLMPIPMLIPIQMPKPDPIPKPMPTPHPASVQLPKPEVDLPLLRSIERSAAQIDPAVLDQPLPPIEQVIPDNPVESHPGTSPIAHGGSNAPSVALQVNAPAQAPVPASPPVPMLELPLEKNAPSNRDFLQVPFNKGASNGMVAITRLPGESIQNLVLSPSNPQVFEQLREPFEQVRDSHWQLNERRDEQQHQGSRQSPDDEQEEPGETAP